MSAITDPLYRQILAGLEAYREDGRFETAVCDLLRDTFPSLVPIPGGSDRGMDGAFADGQGEAFPLVCTTREDVIGNLTASLDSYLGKGGSRRKVVLATSQALTPTRRLNLEKRAREKGFTLIQVLEQRGIADRLYRSSRWLKELLGLTPMPSALSPVPMTRRPLVELPLLGREKELEWLHTAKGDGLIVGQPGSGKTFLLTQLVREKGWLFLVSDDEPGIVAALNEQQPEVVIVDDAHVDLSRLDLLRHLRQERGLTFDIVATTWPGERDAVLSRLGSPAESQQLKLELLGRSTIKAILESLGIREEEEGPELVRELIEQSANKPGLAATLGLVGLRGEWKNLAEGRAIDQALMPLFEERVGGDTRSLLASFALGGSRGMSLDVVARFHGLSLPQVWQRVSALAAGGVLRDLQQQTLAVEPSILRVALLRTVFFPDQPPGLPLDGLIEHTHPGAAAEVIAEAALRGAKVPRPVLHEVLLRADPREEIFRIAPRAWSYAARISTAEAEWVLEHYPGELVHVAEASLRQAPGLAIRKLLRTTVKSVWDRSLPVRLLLDWARGHGFSGKEALERWRLLAREVKADVSEGGDCGQAAQVLVGALSPDVRHSELDALGELVTERAGVLSVDDLRGISRVWEEIMDVLPPLDQETWPRVSNFLWPWLHPESASLRIDPASEQGLLMHSFVAQVLKDLSPQAMGRPGIGAGLREIASVIRLDLPIEVDPTFELLYLSTSADPRLDSKALGPKVEALADVLSSETPEAVAERLAFYEDEARIIGRQSKPRGAAELCRRLARRVTNPQHWLEVFQEKRLSGDLARPFLGEIVKARQAGWVDVALASLGDETTTQWAFELLMREPKLPPELLKAALSHSPALVHSVEALALRRELPLPTLSALLQHPDTEVALAAAVGEWNATPRGEISGEVGFEWREAILRASGPASNDRPRRSSSAYWLGVILAANSALSLGWWRRRASESRLPRLLSKADTLRSSLSCLSNEQRRQLVEVLPDYPGLKDLLPLVVNREEDVFAALLGRPDLSKYHLDALKGKPDSAWADLVASALRHGYEAVAVAAATKGSRHMRIGSGLDYWQKWDAAFAAFENDPRPEVREVAAAGRSLAQAEIVRSEDTERQVDLHGWSGYLAERSSAS